MKTRTGATALLAAAATLLLPGCATTVSGNAAAPADLTVASAPVEMQAAPMGAGQDAVELPLDSLVRSAVRSSALFWQTQGINVDVEPRAVTGKITCADTLFPGSSAAFCPTTTFDLVKYDPALLNQRRADGGDLAVRIVMAHEVGHAARLTSGVVTANEAVAHAELSSDCAAGAALSDAGVNRTDAQTAIRATELGKQIPRSPLTPTQRTEAFFAGFDGTVSPMGCLSYTG